jgi:hypothetical protein
MLPTELIVLFFYTFVIVYIFPPVKQHLDISIIIKKLFVT